MHVFWWQHGLHIQPENQEEANLLVAVVDSLKFDKPEWMKVAGGHGCISSSQFDPDEFVIDQQLIPRDLPRIDLNDQQPVR